MTDDDKAWGQLLALRADGVTVEKLFDDYAPRYPQSVVEITGVDGTDILRNLFSDRAAAAMAHRYKIPEKVELLRHSFASP